MTQSKTDISALLADALDVFEQRFDRPATIAAAAPGRINLIGEHTDYNDGYVLPMAIDRWSVCVGDLSPADHPSARWYSLDLDEEYEADLSNRLQPIENSWVNYPLGVVEEFRQHQVELPNIDFVMTSSVPIGSGLSSSAALTVSLCTLFEQSVGIELDPKKKAAWCQRAEHEFPGVPCGIMDPMIASLAVEDHALFIDCATNDTKLVRMPAPDDAILLIANTCVKHSLATSEYSIRRDECARAVRLAQKELRSDISSLRDVTLDDLHRLRDLTEATLFKRFSHVVNENIRTLESVQALMEGDLVRLGRYMFASHVSLRDDYEVSCAELDTLVELASELSEAISGKDRGVLGARMTGGGFGGCVIVLCRPEAEELVTQYLADGYRATFDRAPTIFATTAASGATPIDLDAIRNP